MTSSVRVTSYAWLLALVLGNLAPGVAWAQGNEAIAESLFIEGKQLYSEEKYAQACQKLAQSHKADPAGGTVLLLAMCYEQLGKTATAWAKYGEAVAVARRDGRTDRAQKAQESMDALAQQLSYAKVSLNPEVQPPASMEFVLDDTQIPTLVDAKVPLDPGAHRLVVRAKGFEPWVHEFQVTDPSAVTTILVPALKPLATSTSPQATSTSELASSGQQQGRPNGANAEFVNQPPDLEPHSSGTTRSLGWVLGGAGLVAAGVGGYFAVNASSLDKKANDRCPSVDCSDSEAVGWSKDAVRDANVSTWLVGLGAIAAVTGGAMVIFGGGSGPSVSTTAVALPNGGVLSISGKY